MRLQDIKVFEILGKRHLNMDNTKIRYIFKTSIQESLASYEL